VAPIWAGCDPRDLGSAWFLSMPGSLQPGFGIFDRVPGGVGLAEKLYGVLPKWIEAAWRLLDSCDCKDGCPMCLLSPRCECMNDLLSKRLALSWLRELRG
jgi:DEAD/DEAH box helicase domain-containing protein